MSPDGRLSFSVRVLKAGSAQGPLLVSDRPISFYGGVDLETGEVTEPGHPLQGRLLAGAMLAFPTGTGSTVGSYALYRLARTGKGPAALLMAEAEPIVVTGAILAGIPCVDQVPVSELASGLWARLEGDRLIVEAARGARSGSD